MDEDFTCNVQHYKDDDDAYLVVMPRYYFGNNIQNWSKTEVGEYYVEILTEKTEKIKGIYIYHTEDGNDWQKIENILEFMKKQENENEWITFAQCFSCNRIATVGSKIYDFNYILTVLDICTKNCHDCYFN